MMRYPATSTLQTTRRSFASSGRLAPAAVNLPMRGVSWRQFSLFVSLTNGHPIGSSVVKNPGNFSVFSFRLFDKSLAAANRPLRPGFPAFSMFVYRTINGGTRSQISETLQFLRFSLFISRTNRLKYAISDRR